MVFEFTLTDEVRRKRRKENDKYNKMQPLCQFFIDSKKALKEHIDKTHRITDSKMAAERTIKRATLSSSIKAAELGTEKDPAE